MLELMNVNVWKAVKRAIRILRTTVSTHNALIAMHSWQLQLSFEKQADFRDHFANVCANIYRLLLRSLKIL